MRRVIIVMLMLLMSSCWTKSEYYMLADSCEDNDILTLSPWKIDLYWEWDNRKYDYYKKDKLFFVALSNIPPKDLSNWLRKNNEHILFEKSIEGILCHHTIGDRKAFALGISDTLTFKQINDKLALASCPQDEVFQHYGALLFDANGKLILRSSNSFASDKHYFSYAFFMAVGRDNGLDNDTRFIFHKAIYKEKNVIVIEVNGTLYDFAQYPPLR